MTKIQMTTAMLTASRLRKVLSYDPATGIFRRRLGGSAVNADRVAGCIGGKGYYQIRVDRKLYQASRLAWLYMTGKWPKLEINSVNRDRSDTRWANLREATPSQRSANARTRNKLGVKGVWITKYGKYESQIRVAGKLKHLGSFNTLEKASAAYVNAAKAAFGQFASAR